MAVVIDGEFKRVEEVVRVSLGEEVIISEAARSRIGKSREAVEDIVREGKRIYGVTTGFGKFADVAISLDDLRTLQENLVVSHAVGTGEEFSEPEVRAAAYLRANALAKETRVRLSVVEAGGVAEQRRVSRRAPERFCGCQRRPRTACPYSPVAYGKGDGSLSWRAFARGRSPGESRHRAAAVGGQRGSGSDERRPDDRCSFGSHS